MPLEVVLTPYAVNDFKYCGPILYKATSEHNLVPTDQFEVFRDGNAQVTSNQLLFSNQNLYPRGFLKITVAVSHNFTESEPAFTVDFSIRIIDCSVSEDYFEFSIGDNVVCPPNKPPLVQD